MRTTKCSHGVSPYACKVCFSNLCIVSQSKLDKALSDQKLKLIKAIDDEAEYCYFNGDYMLDSSDCISIINGTWVRPDYDYLGGNATN